MARPWSVFASTSALGALIVIPRLGSAGLWDPWETHFAEVGRQMLARADLIHPYFERSWFFSKPPLLMWLDAFALWVSGIQPWGSPGTGPMPSGAEWAIRLLPALMMVCSGALLAEAVARMSSWRAGFLTGTVLATMPLWFLLARQNMAEGPLVACQVAALACALLAEHSPVPNRWWFGFFAAIGLGLLTKGLVGALPLVILPLAYVACDGRRWRERLRSVPRWGPAVTLVLAAPWYLAMLAFDGRDEEGRTFFERFFVYDHFQRLASGVHTTTPGGTFAYYVEQGAFGVFPWVALVPVALQALTTSSKTPSRRLLTMVALIWAALTFTLFTASATRFHHYALGILPGLAVLIALGAEEVLETPRRFTGALVAGAVLLLLVTQNLADQPRHLIDLFTYNHQRPYPSEVVAQPLVSWVPVVTAKAALWASVVGALVAGSVAWWRQNRRLLLGGVAGLAMLFGCFVAWKHQVDLGQHWTQKDLVSTYFRASNGDEPLVAFLMNWRGETFYTRNRVVQIKDGDYRRAMAEFAAGSARTWVLVEHARLDVLRSSVPAPRSVEVVDQTSTNKFALVAIR